MPSEDWSEADCQLAAHAIARASRRDDDINEARALALLEDLAAAQGCSPTDLVRA